MGQDQAHPGIARAGLERVPAERRDAAAGVAEHRQALRIREREHPFERRMVEREALGAGVELDPARARRQATLGLGEWVLRRVEPGEGHQQRSRRLGLGEHHVVGGRVAVRLVHREDDRAGVGQVEQLDKLRARAVVAVGVVGAQVGVGVEQLDPGHLVASTVQ